MAGTEAGNDGEEPPQKRARTEQTDGRPKQSRERHQRATVRPLGNLLLSHRSTNARSPGLGSLAVLPDEILAVIFSELDVTDFLRCQATSKCFYAFTLNEGIWKLQFIKRSRGDLSNWTGSWRSSYLHNYLIRNGQAGSTVVELPSDDIGPDGIYSDVLSLPLLAARYDADAIAHAPSFANNISRVDGRTLTDESLGQTPMILTNLMDDWPAYVHGPHRWTLHDLAKRFPATKFRAEAVLTTLRDYLAYHDNCEMDESPLYIFDPDFAEKTRDERSLEEDFKVPDIFADDLFKVLGPARPNYRWLIAGPRRSGSTFHCDPNGTSAWNAVVTGRKLWILFPPDIVPPGIHISADHSEVEAPLSLAEWFMSYYRQAKGLYGPRGKANPTSSSRMLEGVCEAGEIFYVPAGWWHVVVNLESSIAVTQNFVSPTNLPGVMHFLKHRPTQVSGFRMASTAREESVNGEGGEYKGEDEDESGDGKVFTTFVEALKLQYPELCLTGLKGLARLEVDQPSASVGMSHPSVSVPQDGSGAASAGGLWSTLTGQPASDGGTGFSLGLDLDEDGGLL